MTILDEICQKAAAVNEKKNLLNSLLFKFEEDLREGGVGVKVSIKVDVLSDDSVLLDKFLLSWRRVKEVWRLCVSSTEGEDVNRCFVRDCSRKQRIEVAKALPAFSAKLLETLDAVMLECEEAIAAVGEGRDVLGGDGEPRAPGSQGELR